MTENLTYITILVLLPIIPAYILYRTLPSRAMVRGPFKGLNIQLSGAFAGYFLVLLLMLSFVYTRLKLPRTEYEIWTIKGKISFMEDTSSIPRRSILLFIRPPDPSTNEDGTFTMEILAKTEPAAVTKFPTLIVDYPGYVTANVDLNQKPAPFTRHYDKTHNKETNEIIINDPILLAKQDTPLVPISTEPQPINLPTEVNP